MEKEKWGEVLSFLELTGAAIEGIPEALDTADDETVLEILRQTSEMDQRNWVLQSYIFYFVFQNAPRKGKDTALKNIADSIGMSRPAAYELKKIYEYILSVDLELVKLYGLKKNHFIKIIRNLKTIEEKELDIITLLHKASEELWTAQQLESFIKDKTIRIPKVVWYKISGVNENEPKTKWVSDNPVELNRATKMYCDVNEQVYLKITQYE